MITGLAIGKNLKLINMQAEEKINLNKLVRNYTGTNTFIISLQKQLKSSKHLDKIEIGKRKVRVLSEKQYDAVKGIISSQSK